LLRAAAARITNAFKRSVAGASRGLARQAAAVIEARARRRRLTAFEREEEEEEEEEEEGWLVWQKKG